MEHSTGICFAIRLIQVALSRLSSWIPGTNIYASMDGSHWPINKSRIGFERFTGAPKVLRLLTSSPNLDDAKFHGCHITACQVFHHPLFLCFRIWIELLNPGKVGNITLA